MIKRRYTAPLLMESSKGDEVIGQGTGQGTIYPQGMTYEEWLEEIAWGIEGSVEEDGANGDADYNGDGIVNKADWQYALDNHYWEP